MVSATNTPVGIQEGPDDPDKFRFSAYRDHSLDFTLEGGKFWVEMEIYDRDDEHGSCFSMSLEEGEEFVKWLQDKLREAREA